MIQHLEITGIHMQVGDDLRKYVSKKIGGLERYIPKDSRQSAHVSVLLKETKQKGAKECICEVNVHLPHEEINVKEGTVNMFAAIDIAQTKLTHQLRKYKQLHANPRLHQRILTRFKRQPA